MDIHPCMGSTPHHDFRSTLTKIQDADGEPKVIFQTAASVFEASAGISSAQAVLQKQPPPPPGEGGGGGQVTLYC